METVDVEFDWDKPSVKENNGHNQSEWGIRTPDTIFNKAYKMRWE